MTGAEAEGLVARVASFLPTHDFTVHEPPEVADLDLPAPRVGVPVSLALMASYEVADRAAHAHGKAFRDVVRNLEGDVRHAPDVVLRPRREQDVVTPWIGRPRRAWRSCPSAAAPRWSAESSRASTRPRSAST